MNFIGIDVHSRYDQVVLLDDQGEMHPSQRYDGDERARLVEFVKSNALAQWRWKRAAEPTLSSISSHQ